MFRSVLLMVLFGNAICGQAQKTYEEVENEVISLYFDTLVPAYLDQRLVGNPRGPGFKDAVIYVDSVLGDVSKMTYGGLFCAYIMEDPWGGMTEIFAAGCGDSTLQARPFHLNALPSALKRSLAPWSDKVDPAKVKVRAGFSRVLVDSTFTRAVFYGEIWCGGLCGEGVAYFVEKVDGRWQTKMRRRIWVS